MPRAFTLVVDALLLFPHQLFASNKALAREKHVFLIEDPLCFGQYAFHKQKLILHRASMRMHVAFLQTARIEVHYLDLAQALMLSSASDSTFW